MHFKYAIVITGGIAVGKSTVKNLLKLHGYYCIDADHIAHKMLDLHHKDIASLFGSEYVLKDKVDRKKLGKIIFANNTLRQKLESFIHPLVRQEIQELSIVQEKKEFTYFIDIPLFFESKKLNKNNYNIDNSLVVYTPLEIQLKRLIARDLIAKEDALNKINSQISVEQKKKLATYVIDNSRDLPHLQMQCDEFMKKIQSQ